MGFCRWLNDDAEPPPLEKNNSPGWHIRRAAHAKNFSRKSLFHPRLLSVSW